MTVSTPWILLACVAYVAIGCIVARICVHYQFPENEVAIGCIVLFWPSMIVAVALVTVMWVVGKIVGVFLGNRRP